MTNARDYRISYQDVIPRNTTVLPTTVHNITVQNATEPEQRNTEQGSLVMRERFGDISGNNNWLRCKLHNYICKTLGATVVSMGAAGWM